MKILIATDGSEFGTTTIDFASRLIGNGAEVKLITVIEPAAGTELETIIESTDELTDPENPEVQRAAAMLRRSKERLLGKLEGVEAIVSGEVLAWACTANHCRNSGSMESRADNSRHAWARILAAHIDRLGQRPGFKPCPLLSRTLRSRFNFKAF